MKILNDIAGTARFEISSREAAEMVVALTLLRMTLTMGNAFSGNPLDQGHRLPAIGQMRDELNALLAERRRGGDILAKEVEDGEQG